MVTDPSFNTHRRPSAFATRFVAPPLFLVALLQLSVMDPVIQNKSSQGYGGHGNLGLGDRAPRSAPAAVVLPEPARHAMGLG